jgi:glycosyltransferase involved in cell wall biosynthesis
MSRVAIVSLTVQPGNAVGHDALHIQRLLSARGHEAVLFSSHWAAANPLTRDVADVEGFLAGDADAVLLYHHAVGWEDGVALVCRASCRRVVRYHNVTPARFFAGWPGNAAVMCARGREQLADLVAARCDLYLSDSAYNQSELLALGAEPTRCAVVHPFHQIDGLLQTAPDPELLARLRDGHVNLLFVGRRAPNKGHRFLIDAFAAYAEHYNSRSRLLLVGREDPPVCGYTNRLREQASRLGVADRVVFVDSVTESQLRSYYECAAALVVASEHEGFCVPVAEAMALGVPVAAYAACAVADTAAGAALLWPEPDPLLLAASADRLARDGAARALLAAAGRRRYHDRFATDRLEADFLGALAPLAAA